MSEQTIITKGEPIGINPTNMDKATEDLIRDLVRPKPSRAKLRYSYSAANSRIFKGIFTELFKSGNRLYLSSDSFNIAANTLYQKLQDALKYLSEVEDPEKWAPVRAKLAIKKIERGRIEGKCGVIIYSRADITDVEINMERVKLVIERSKLRQDYEKTEDNIKNGEVGEVLPLRECKDPEWKLAFHNWLSNGVDGEIFQWPPVIMAANRITPKFTESDRLYIIDSLKFYENAELEFSEDKILISK